MDKNPRSIAIDGPAASGKSTLGSALADTLGYAFLDTGQMYRAVTRKALHKGLPLADGNALARLAETTSFSLHGRTLLVDGVPSGGELHTPQVDAAVSQVSAHPQVRSALVRVQRELGEGGNIVMVGRDIGTVVLPDAPIKLWLTASGAERATRRLKDQANDDATVGHEDVLQRLEARDRFDRTRQDSPLVRAVDAILIDTDGRTPGQVLDQALAALGAAFWDGPS